MSPRPYDSARRKQGAEATKDRILASARALLAGRSPQLSLDAVAKHADVSRQTVYNAFGGKHGLLEALCDHLAGRGGLHRLGDAFTSQDPLGELVATFAAFWAHDLVATRRLRAFAALDDDLRAVIADRDGRRRLAITQVLRRTGVSADDRLITLLWTVTSFETYDTVAGEQGHDEAVATLRAAATTLAGIGTGE